MSSVRASYDVSQTDVSVLICCFLLLFLHRQPKQPALPTKFYLDPHLEPTYFYLDEHCTDKDCVGTVAVFKYPVYYDKKFMHEVGYSIGTCKIVALHPDEHKPPTPQYYCTFSVILDKVYHYSGEVALAGVVTPFPDVSTVLITAGAGDYKYEGSVKIELKEESCEKAYYEHKPCEPHKYVEYHFELH